MKGLNLLYKKSIILLFFILLNTINMFPCTIFCAHYNGEVWAGNNEDWNDQDTWIWFIPGNETSYGRIFTGYESAFAQGGMNEKGLFFDKFQRNNTGILAPNDPNKLNYKSSLPILPEKILAECATVTEALEFYDTYNEPFLGSYIFFFADSSGDSATIGWNWQTKKVEITRTSKNYQVIGASEGAVTWSLKKNNTDVSLERFTALLKTAKHRLYTVYSSVYDLVNKNIYLYYNHNFSNMKQWYLMDELKKPAHSYSMRALFPEEKNDTRPTRILLQSDYSLLLLPLGIVFLISCIGTAFWIFRIFRRIYKQEYRKHSKLETGIIYSAIGVIIVNGLLYLFAAVLFYYYPGFLIRHGFAMIQNSFGLIPVSLAVFTCLQVGFCIVQWIKRYLLFSERIVFTISTILFILISVLYLFLKNMY